MRRSQKLKVAYFAQHQLDELRLNETPYQHVAELMVDSTEAKIRARCARMGFPEILFNLFPGMGATLLAVVTFISIVPPLAILPILFIALGLGETSKVALYADRPNVVSRFPGTAEGRSLRGPIAAAIAVLANSGVPAKMSFIVVFRLWF